MVVNDVRGAGRAGQRRRTRQAILDAAAQILETGEFPSVDEVAAAAEVSRRTVYEYFPTLDQLLLDASLSTLAADAAAAIDRAGSDVQARVMALVDLLALRTETDLPLGRHIVRLTVDSKENVATPRRGWRRVQWIEMAVSPWRGRVPDEELDVLVSALAVLVGWEAYIVLLDVRNLSPAEAHGVIAHSVRVLLASVAPRPS